MDSSAMMVLGLQTSGFNRRNELKANAKIAWVRCRRSHILDLWSLVMQTKEPGSIYS